MNDLNVFTKFDVVKETGDIDGAILYNYFFTRIKGNLLKPILLSDLDISEKVMNELYLKYSKKYKDYLKQIIIIFYSEYKDEKVLQFFEDLFKFFLLGEENNIGRGVKQFIEHNPTDLKFSVPHAIDYLLSGIVFVNGLAIFNKKIYKYYDSVEQFIKENNVKTVLPVTKDDGIYIYYPSINKLVKVSNFV